MLSGQPLKDISTNLIKNFYRETKGKINIIGVGATDTTLDGKTNGTSVYLGITAGAANTTAGGNDVGIGYSALLNSGGNDNTGVGANALQNVNGNYNTAVWSYAGFSTNAGISSASNNSLFGYASNISPSFVFIFFEFGNLKSFTFFLKPTM